MSISHTILLVEDNRNDILLMQRAFRKANIITPLQVVEDGDGAVQYLLGERQYADRSLYPLPAVILLDLKLPRLSGFEVLEWRQQQPELRRLPVVVLTSSGEMSDVHRAYDLGANSYLVKPPTSVALEVMMQSVNSYWLAYNHKPQFQDA
jgi:CheY-like chemotaxis protein